MPPRLPARSRARIIDSILWWWVLPLAGALWSAWLLRRSYYFYDEWSMIDQVLHRTPLEGTMASFNGHLWMLQFWNYWMQVYWFGLDDHLFVSLTFIVTVVALHVSLAALFRAAGQSHLMSLLLGGLLTYLGAASQTFMFAVLGAPALSLAAGIAAAAIALGRPRPSPWHVTAFVLLTLLSVASDSAASLVSLTLATVISILVWRGSARFAAVPAMVMLMLWMALGDRGPVEPSTMVQRIVFAGRLVLRGSGSVIGRGKTYGALLLIGTLVILARGLRRGDVDPHSRVTLIAGSAATILVTLALASARAGIPAMNFTDFNRYLQAFAIPALVAAVPALSAIIRAWAQRDVPVARHWMIPFAGPYGAPVLVIVAFLLGLQPQQAYYATFEQYSVDVHAGVASALTVIRDGCLSGAAPDDASLPLDALSPQVSTRLLRELVDLKRITTPAGHTPDPVIVSRMCPGQDAAETHAPARSM